VIAVKISGDREVATRLRRLKVSRAAAVALNEIAETTMTDAKARTPVEFGVLKASGKVSDHATVRDLTARLTYGTEYAVFVHERTELRHRVGEAKFLERAVNKTAGTLARDVTVKVRSILGL